MSEGTKVRRVATKYQTKLSDLVGAGLIKPGERIQSTSPAWPAEASINADGSVNLAGRTYATPSAAGAAVRQGMATNGWSMWAVKTDTGVRTLAAIRADYDATETRPLTEGTRGSGVVGIAVEAAPIDSQDPSDLAVAAVPVIADEAGESPGLITSFGMFWRRDQLNWNNSGRLKLLGQQAGGARKTDFAEQIGVYLLHDGARTVYVGRVSKPRMGARLAEHTKDRLSGRWDRFSWFGLRPVLNGGVLGGAAETFGTDLVVATMEAILIEGLEPPQNRRQGDGMTGQEYQQAIDEQRQERLAMETMVRMFQERTSL